MEKIKNCKLLKHVNYPILIILFTKSTVFDKKLFWKDLGKWCIIVKKKCFLLKRKPVHFSKLWCQAQISLSICGTPKRLLLLWTSSWIVLDISLGRFCNLNIINSCFSFNSYYYSYDLFQVNNLLFTWNIH